MMALELLTLPFLFAVKLFRYVFYAPATFGGDFLVFARDDLGWPVPASEGLSELPYWLNTYLLYFNWFCYAALGFFIGWMLGRFFQRFSKPL